MCASRCQALPITIEILERQPLASQVFLPMSADPMLVVVAPDRDGEPGAPRAFLTRPGQGANLLRRAWHGVLTPRFVDGDDMHVNIVTFQPGASIPFAETHVMEHGIYVLQGKAVYRLNEDWVEVEAGDYIWLRAFCPQGCYAGGPDPFRYLLYKDVNRIVALLGPGAPAPA